MHTEDHFTLPGNLSEISSSNVVRLASSFLRGGEAAGLFLEGAIPKHPTDQPGMHPY